MFRVFRLPILLLVAFLTGLMFERAQNREACRLAGGAISAEGPICVGVIGDG